MRAIIFIVILLNILFSTQYAEAQTIKLGTLAPDGSPWYTSLRDMDERWKEASNDEVRLKIYPGGVLGDEGDMIRRMRIGMSRKVSARRDWRIKKVTISSECTEIYRRVSKKVFNTLRRWRWRSAN